MMDSPTEADVWEPHMKLLLGALDEKQRRWVAGLMSEMIGYGGISRVARISGLDHKTISRGRRDLQSNLEGCPQGRIRAQGAGRPSLQQKTPR